MRAGNGDGSITSRKTKTKGVVWDVQVTVKDTTGVSHRATKRGLPTRKAASDWRDAEQRKVKAALKAGPVALTVPALVERYLKEAPRLEGSTLKSYSRMHRLYISKMLRVKASSLTEARLQIFANEIVAAVKEKGSSGTATVLIALATVRSAYAWGATAKVGLLNYNPIADAQITTAPVSSDRRALTHEEVHRLMGVSTDRSRTIWEMMLETAGRAGELLALTWGDFDEAVNRVSFNKILSPETNYREVAPRTKGKADRHAYISDELSSKLTALREERGASAHDPVFVTVRGPQRRMGMISMRQMWTRDTEAAGLKGRKPHELRHTWATMALANGMDVQSVAAVLGHKDLTTVLKYLHMQNGGAAAANSLRASLRYP